MLALEAADESEAWGTLGNEAWDTLGNKGKDGQRAGDDDEDSDSDNDDNGKDTGKGKDGTGPLDGTVSSFRGDCPAVTFSLRGTTIVTDSSTTYAGGGCATLRPNVKVIVRRARAGTTDVPVSRNASASRRSSGR